MIESSVKADSNGSAFDGDDIFPHDELEVTAWCDDGLVMAVRHKRLPHVQGVQFHPESIITDGGLKIISNWIEDCQEFHRSRRDGSTHIASAV